jgi:hypothetical protein
MQRRCKFSVRQTKFRNARNLVDVQHLVERYSTRSQFHHLEIYSKCADIVNANYIVRFLTEKILLWYKQQHSKVAIQKNTKSQGY